MSSAYEIDRAWADQYEPELAEILRRNGWRLMRVRRADEQDDVQHATDLRLETDRGDVACRVRRDDCYHRDLTLRYRRRPWGQRKAPWARGYEVDKILAGYAELYIYAWVRR
jgi:hypothetical protein